MKVFTAKDIENMLSADDKVHIHRVSTRYEDVLELFKDKAKMPSSEFRTRLIRGYEEVGTMLKEIVSATPQLSVYAFDLPHSDHGSVSRIVSKLRDPNTAEAEFLYYTQRAFELLFALAFSSSPKKRTHIVVKTPVTEPAPAYAVHRIPNIDENVENTVMCVLLRGALLPSIIVSKEIQEFSSSGYLTPFALFKVQRDESKNKSTMQYKISLEQSYFDVKQLHNKHLIFADPMNATGGSILAVMNMLQEMDVQPASTKILSIITSLEGGLRTARAMPNCVCHTLWLDPWLNDKAYILPGLGDAGDRLNGVDDELHPRKIIRLLAKFGHMQDLYTKQFEAVENAVLLQREL